MPTASAPGKVILMGEHAAVYGRPALVAAAGLRLTATIAPARSGVSLDVTAFPSETPGEDPAPALRQTTGWREITAMTRRAREAWQRYVGAPSSAGFREVLGASERSGSARLLCLALGESVEALRDEGRPEPGPLALSIRSQIPVGSGFGSSAAAAVAVVMAYLAFRGVLPDPERVHRISLAVEQRQHGTPSGVDNATVIHGGVLAARRMPSEDDGVELEPVTLRPERLRRFRIVASGPPAEGTGTVVAAVRELRDRRPQETEAVFDRLSTLTALLRQELGGEEDRPEEVGALVREAEALLERLGVVPEPVRRLIRAIEARGGAAKISGAGSLAGPGAGNLLLHHPDPDALRGVLDAASEAVLHELHPKIYGVELGVPGARLEGGR